MVSTTANIRAPQMAGHFYPAEAGSCAGQIKRFLDDALPVSVSAPQIIIAPHAGHVYSGPIAATAYKTLAAHETPPRRIVLLGPAHRVPFRGLAVSDADYWATPLGDIRVDRDGAGRLVGDELAREYEDGFLGEHSLEVHLPFLQSVLSDFVLLPVLVGDASYSQVSAAIDALWADDTVFVVSSDLSHFLDYDTARARDARTRAAIETLDETMLDGEAACGCRIVGGALLQAKQRDLRVTGVDLRNSGDTAGDKARVVGYGAFVFEAAARARLSDDDRGELLAAAATALDEAAANGGAVKPGSPTTTSYALSARRASFVTLKKDGKLRGCVGSVRPVRSLIEDVAANAVRAGFGDSRFPALTRDELERLDVEISILSHPRQMRFSDDGDLVRQLRPGVDGLILQDGEQRGLFLPAVWESLPSPVDFVAHLIQKAGLPRYHWSDSLRVFRFSAEKFGGAFDAASIERHRHSRAG